jgi:hypothetical protein
MRRTMPGQMVPKWQICVRHCILLACRRKKFAYCDRADVRVSGAARPGNNTRCQSEPKGDEVIFPADDKDYAIKFIYKKGSEREFVNCLIFTLKEITKGKVISRSSHRKKLASKSPEVEYAAANASAGY